MANVFILMIHISQEELLKKIRQEHKQLLLDEEKEFCSRDCGPYRPREDMSSILPMTYGNLRDKNNNSTVSKDEDEVQAVLITGNCDYMKKKKKQY